MTAKKKQGIKRWNSGGGHSYSIDGKRAIGVTTALKALPKNLTRWAARTVAEHVVANIDSVRSMLAAGGEGPTVDYLGGLPNQVRNSAAVRGTAVHGLAERVMHGDAVEVPAELEGYVASYIAYCDEWQPVPVVSEVTVASRTHGYAGTLDSIQDVPSLGRVLVDYKTSRGIYGETALQVAAYRYADVYLDDEGDERPMIPVQDTAVLHIRPDGYDLLPLVADEFAFNAFLGVLSTYRTLIRKQQSQTGLDRLIGAPLVAPVLEVAA